MNEPRHIKETMIRMLDGRIRAITLRIEELVKTKGSWVDVEVLMNSRDELTKILNDLKSNSEE